MIGSGKLVGAYPEVIKPGEMTYYCDTRSLDISEVTEAVVLPRPVADVATVDCIGFPVTDINLIDGGYVGPRVTGQIENTSDEVQNMVYVSAMLFDKNDVPVVHAFTIIVEDLHPGDKIGFEAFVMSLSEGVAFEDLGDVQVTAYPTQFQF